MTLKVRQKACQEWSLLFVLSASECRPIDLKHQAVVKIWGPSVYITWFHEFQPKLAPNSRKAFARLLDCCT